MQIYLPIAEIPVNIIIILLLGLATGVLAGMFGIGGGFLSTPFLMFVGIPPTIAVATSANQIIASSASGLFAHLRKGSVDVKMGLFLVLGGFIGSSFGVSIFSFLRKSGHTDIVVGITYIVVIGSVSITMFKDSALTLIRSRFNISHSKKDGVLLTKFLESIKNLPWKVYFPKSEIEVSVIVPVLLSVGVGILVAMMGIGGGFLMIPAMIYILRMPSNIVVGTSLFQIIFIASNTTFLQSIANNAVDIVLALLMIVSSSIGAQLGTHVGYKVNADKLRILLSLLLLGMCIKMLFLLLSQPESLYSIEVIK